MSHSYHHAVSSARTWGGDASDYIPIHDWLDATKALVADTRHRALRHHQEIIGGAYAALHTDRVENSDGVIVSVEGIVRQHLREDFGGLEPRRAEWVESVVLADWMQPSLAHSRDTVLWHCARRFGGEAADYAPLYAWFDEGVTDDPRTRYERGHAYGCFWAQECFGPLIASRPFKPVPTRLVAEFLVSRMYESRLIPAASDWLRAMRRPSWVRQPLRLAA